MNFPSTVYHYLIVRFLLAIVCCLLVAGAPMLPAQTAAASCPKGEGSAHPCCHHGCTMPCCRPKQANNSERLPSMPAANQNQLSFLLMSAATPISLPARPIFSSPIAMPLALVSTSQPLYARDCALLL